MWCNTESGIGDSTNMSRTNANDKFSEPVPSFRKIGNLKLFDTKADYCYSKKVLEKHSLRMLHREDVLREIVLNERLAEAFCGKGFYIERKESDALNLNTIYTGFFIPGKNAVLEYIGKRYNERSASWENGFFDGKPVIYVYSGSGFEIFFVYKYPVDGRRFVFDSSYNSNNIVPIIVGMEKEGLSGSIDKSLVSPRT